MIQEDPLSEIPEDEFDRPIEDFYDLLKVDRRAASSEIQEAYREMVQKYHPDSSDIEGAEEITFALNKAKDILLSENTRIRYNEIGHSDYFTESLTSSTTPVSNQDDTHEDYESSVYDLIKLAKVRKYTNEPWWKTLIKSTGFKLVLSVSLFLFFSFLLLLSF